LGWLRLLRNRRRQVATSSFRSGPVTTPDIILGIIRAIMIMGIALTVGRITTGVTIIPGGTITVIATIRSRIPLHEDL
jgi:hypothetical protein